MEETTQVKKPDVLWFKAVADDKTVDRIKKAPTYPAFKRSMSTAALGAIVQQAKDAGFSGFKSCFKAVRAEK